MFLVCLDVYRILVEGFEDKVYIAIVQSIKSDTPM